jgi:ACS family glucarate transporter-like MFS transporter
VGIAFLMWAAVTINYIDRANIAVAVPIMTKEFNLSPAVMGVVLSAFFWSYVVFQIPMGWIADRIGQRIGFALSVAWWSAATCATALARGAVSLIGLRVALGVGEAGAYPCATGVTAKWFPDKERARVSGLFDSGSKLGAAIALPTTAWLISLFGWKAAFVISGALGLVWSAVWWMYHREEPEHHKSVNEAELQYIRKGQAVRRVTDTDKPMKRYELLRYRNVWAVCIGFFMLNYHAYFFITWFPAYLVKEQHLSLVKMGFLASIPLFVATFSECLAGIISDMLYSRGWGLTKVRKTTLALGMTLAASIALTPLFHSLTWIMVIMTISKCGGPVAASQIWSLPGDIAPKNMASFLGALQNTVSNMAGVVGPIITGLIIQATGSFSGALVAVGGATLLGALNFLFLLGKVEPIRPKGISGQALAADNSTV